MTVGIAVGVAISITVGVDISIGNSVTPLVGVGDDFAMGAQAERISINSETKVKTNFIILVSPLAAFAAQRAAHQPRRVAKRSAVAWMPLLGATNNHGCTSVPITAVL